MLGAHIEETDQTFKTGTPTVIIAGVVSEKTATGGTSDPKRFVLASETDPGEYPTQTTFSHFESNAMTGNGRIVFVVE